MGNEPSFSLDSKEIETLNLQDCSPQDVKLKSRKFKIFTTFQERYRDDYKVLKLIGSGGFGIVQSVLHSKTRDVRVMKTIYKTKLTMNGIKELINEVQFLKAFSEHPNIPTFYGGYEDEKKIYIIQEFCKGGDLLQCTLGTRKRLNADQIAEVVAQVCDVLEILHYHNICHCDLKPENVLFKNEINFEEKSNEELSIAVIDFGISKKKSSFEWLERMCGTPEYMAPELLKKNYNCACDMWALGILVFELFNHHTPFPFKGKIKETIQQTLQGFQNITKTGQGLENRGPWFREGKSVPEDAKDFIVKLLKVDPAERLTASEASAHTFLTRINNKRDRSHAMLLKDLERHSAYPTLAIFLKSIINKNDQEEQIPKDLFKSAKKIFEDACKIQNITDGRLNFQAFYQHAMKLTNWKADKTELIKLFIEMDTDFNQYICFEEFLTHCIWSHQKHQDDRLVKTILAYLDSGDDGYIDIEKVKASFKNEPELAETLNSNFIEIMKNEVDGNGHLSISSFLKILQTSSRSNHTASSREMSINNLSSLIDTETLTKKFEYATDNEEDTIDDLLNNFLFENMISESAANVDQKTIKKKNERTIESIENCKLRRSINYLQSTSKKNINEEKEAPREIQQKNRCTKTICFCF